MNINAININEKTILATLFPSIIYAIYLRKSSLFQSIMRFIGVADFCGISTFPSASTESKNIRSGKNEQKLKLF